MNKLNVCIIFGGQSSEHTISCLSASNVIENMDTAKYNIFKIGITPLGKWLMTEASPADIKNGDWLSHKSNKTAFISPDATVGSIILSDGTGIKIDVAFPVLHGLYGEDGTIQGLLTLAKIPYVGTKVLGSAICMDKAVAKAICANANIKQCKFLSFTKYEIQNNHSNVIDKIENNLLYPIFVKPANAGSSVGITKAKNLSELTMAIEVALKEDDKIVVEEGVIGRELECAVLGNGDPKASICGEVLPAEEFYDFDAKYNNPNSKTQIPANIPKEKMEEMQALAIKAYSTLCCCGFARVDFFLNEKDELLLNEINTIPGFTSISMYPKMWEKSGLPYNELIDKLIELAVE